MRAIRLVPERAMPKMKIGVQAMALHRHRCDDDVVALSPLVDARLQRGNEISASIHNRWIVELERHLHEQLVDVHAEVPGGDRLEAAFNKRGRERAIAESVHV